MSDKLQFVAVVRISLLVVCLNVRHVGSDKLECSDINLDVRLHKLAVFLWRKTILQVLDKLKFIGHQC